MSQESVRYDTLMHMVNEQLDKLSNKAAKQMRSTLEGVKEFHEAFGHPVKDSPDVSDHALNELRVKLIQEELDELKEALTEQSKVETLDALLDIQYVLDGAFLALGFHRVKMEGFRRVHESNMSKLGPDNKPILREDGKVQKGPDFKPVDLKDLC
jgi:predicted HAD superfamily Cof-like phosphohydrolase